MKKVTLTAFCAATSFLFSCAPAQEKKTKEVVVEKTEEIIIEEVEPVLNVDSILTSIQQEKEKIETEIKEPVVISTETLREKVKQKWEKIHFYLLDEKVVRIKTYPYDKISTRTEEFYLKDGNLILAVIEDNGAGDRMKKSEEIDKMYYFFDNELLKEVKSGEAEEYSVKDGDAEELLAEVKEYLAIYATKQ